jgi:bifunctional non-homologous end joining protein LigD
MHATELSRPFHRDGWVYEEKYDGWRMVAYKYGKAIRLVSRVGTDHTKRFPGLVAALQTLPAFSLILDGEVCRFDERLVSRFEWLHRRPTDETATPPVLVVFDCLYARRKDLRDWPLRARRHVLEAEVASEHFVLPARQLEDDGLKAWQEVVDRGYEGLVAKNPASPYVGGRTLKWVKVKQPKHREVERSF